MIKIQDLTPSLQNVVEPDNKIGKDVEDFNNITHLALTLTTAEH